MTSNETKRRSDAALRFSFRFFSVRSFLVSRVTFLYIFLSFSSFSSPHFQVTVLFVCDVVFEFHLSCWVHHARCHHPASVLLGHIGTLRVSHGQSPTTPQTLSLEDRAHSIHAFSRNTSRLCAILFFDSIVLFVFFLSLPTYTHHAKP